MKFPGWATLKALPGKAKQHLHPGHGVTNTAGSTALGGMLNASGTQKVRTKHPIRQADGQPPAPLDWAEPPQQAVDALRAHFDGPAARGAAAGRPLEPGIRDNLTDDLRSLTQWLSTSPQLAALALTEKEAVLIALAARPDLPDWRRDTFPGAYDGLMGKLLEDRLRGIAAVCDPDRGIALADPAALKMLRSLSDSGAAGWAIIDKVVKLGARTDAAGAAESSRAAQERETRAQAWREQCRGVLQAARVLDPGGERSLSDIQAEARLIVETGGPDHPKRLAARAMHALDLQRGLRTAAQLQVPDRTAIAAVRNGLGDAGQGSDHAFANARLSKAALWSKRATNQPKGGLMARVARAFRKNPLDEKAMATGRLMNERTGTAIASMRATRESADRMSRIFGELVALPGEQARPRSRAADAELSRFADDAAYHHAVYAHWAKRPVVTQQIMRVVSPEQKEQIKATVRAANGLDEQTRARLCAHIDGLDVLQPESLQKTGWDLVGALRRSIARVELGELEKAHSNATGQAAALRQREHELVQEAARLQAAQREVTRQGTNLMRGTARPAVGPRHADQEARGTRERYRAVLRQEQAIREQQEENRADLAVVRSRLGQAALRTDDFESALARAREATGGTDVATATDEAIVQRLAQMPLEGSDRHGDRIARARRTLAELEQSLLDVQSELSAGIDDHSEHRRAREADAERAATASDTRPLEQLADLVGKFEVGSSLTLTNGRAVGLTVPLAIVNFAIPGPGGLAGDVRLRTGKDAVCSVGLSTSGGEIVFGTMRRNLGSLKAGGIGGLGGTQWRCGLGGTAGYTFEGSGTNAVVLRIPRTGKAIGTGHGEGRPGVEGDRIVASRMAEILRHLDVLFRQEGGTERMVEQLLAAFPDLQITTARDRDRMTDKVHKVSASVSAGVGYTAHDPPAAPEKDARHGFSILNAAYTAEGSRRQLNKAERGPYRVEERGTRTSVMGTASVHALGALTGSQSHFVSAQLQTHDRFASKIAKVAMEDGQPNPTSSLYEQAPSLASPHGQALWRKRIWELAASKLLQNPQALKALVEQPVPGQSTDERIAQLLKDKAYELTRAVEAWPDTPDSTFLMFSAMKPEARTEIGQLDALARIAERDPMLGEVARQADTAARRAILEDDTYTAAFAARLVEQSRYRSAGTPVLVAQKSVAARAGGVGHAI